MTRATWQRLDLEGAGLQSANMTFARLRKRRALGFVLLLPFPLGLHRAYLEDHQGAWAYRLASLLALGAYLGGYSALALLLGLGLCVYALYDVRWIDQQVIRLNKALRLRVCLKPGPGVPPDFTGRPAGIDAVLADYLRQKEQERAGQGPVAGEQAADAPPPRQAPSLAEQEAWLKGVSPAKRPPR
ncbi:MAG: TM2 domain-containing protein [Betaproteobacteria bacterium]|nr:TM2 domain-containing protein [Betaproteobacteria bacterium]